VRRFAVSGTGCRVGVGRFDVAMRSMLTGPTVIGVAPRSGHHANANTGGKTAITRAAHAR
jgi:hypothetical protein